MKTMIVMGVRSWKSIVNAGAMAQRLWVLSTGYICGQSNREACWTATPLQIVRRGRGLTGCGIYSGQVLHVEGTADLCELAPRYSVGHPGQQGGGGHQHGEQSGRRHHCAPLLLSAAAVRDTSRCTCSEWVAFWLASGAHTKMIPGRRRTEVSLRYARRMRGGVAGGARRGTFFEYSTNSVETSVQGLLEPCLQMTYVGRCPIRCNSTIGRGYFNRRGPRFPSRVVVIID